MSIQQTTSARISSYYFIINSSFLQNRFAWFSYTRVSPKNTETGGGRRCKPGGTPRTHGHKVSLADNNNTQGCELISIRLNIKCPRLKPAWPHVSAAVLGSVRLSPRPCGTNLSELGSFPWWEWRESTGREPQPLSVPCPPLPLCP